MALATIAGDACAVVGGYRRYPPPRCLLPAAAGLWIHKTPHVTTAPYHRVLPDPGAAVVFYCLRGADGRPRQAELCLHGPIVTPRRFALEPGRELAGVAIHPEWLATLLASSAREHHDAVMPLHHIVPGFADRCLAALLASRSADAALRVLVDLLAERLRSGRPEPPIRLRHALQLQRDGRGAPGVGELAGAVGWSPRHLHRVCRDALGLGPKRLAGQLRFLAVIEAADRQARPPWADLASRFGYFDQSHLIADAQRLGWDSPGVLHAERRAQS